MSNRGGIGFENCRLEVAEVEGGGTTLRTLLRGCVQRLTYFLLPMGSRGGKCQDKFPRLNEYVVTCNVLMSHPGYNTKIWPR